MFRQISSVYFLLLYVCFQLCGQACGSQSESLSNVVDGDTISDFFKLTGKEIDYEFNSEGTQKGKITDVKNIGPVFLVANSDFLVALAEVKNGKPDNEKIDLLAKYLRIKDKNLSEEAFKINGKEWKTQLVSENLTDLKGKFKVKSSAVVVNGNKIYHFLVTDTTVARSVFEETPADFKWQITVIVGEIDSDGLQKNEAMKWGTLGLSKLTNVEKLNEKLKIDSKKIPPVFSFGFAIGDTIVFAIQGEGKEGSSKGKTVTVFFQLNEQANELKLLHEEPTENCHPSLFLWEEKIVMVPTACEKDGDQKIRTFNYKEKQSKAHNEVATFLQEFLKDKKNFVTTKIDTTTDVLLFSQQKKLKEHEVNLWMTDGKRTAKVDTIITESKDNIDVSIFYIKNELFVLQKQKTGGATVDKYDLKRLPELSTKPESILKAWENTDNEIKMLFKGIALTDTFFTDGLVCFLSGSVNDAEWLDKYFYEKAKVTSGTKYGQGFKFNGAESRAEWPVGKAKADQPYNFANPGFTLLATVTVEDGTSSNYNSILGVSLKGLNSHVGLWCAKEGMWGVGDVKSTTKGTVSAKECIKKKTYQVALVYQENKISVYIDWELLGDEQNFEIIDEKQEELQFYFGAHTAQSNVESHVAVTNVLLYNRPFEQGKINELRQKVKAVEDIKKLEGVDTNTTGNSDQHPQPLPTDEKEKKSLSPSRTEDGGVGGGVRVFSLLLAALCVSAPLLHL